MHQFCYWAIKFLHSHSWNKFLFQVLHTECSSAVVKLLASFFSKAFIVLTLPVLKHLSTFRDSRQSLFSLKCFPCNKKLDKVTRFDKDNSFGHMWVLIVSQDNSFYIWCEDTGNATCIIITHLYVAWLLLSQTLDLWYSWENVAGGEGQRKPLSK